MNRVSVSISIPAIFLASLVLFLSSTGWGEAMDTATPPTPAGMPYEVQGKTYYPVASTTEGFEETGIASWYGPRFQGKPTSAKEVYNMDDQTAAHKTLPLNTWVRVTHLENGRETVVRINDRGPFVNDRIIDLSRFAAKQLGILQKGTGPVKLTVLKSQPAKEDSTAPLEFTVQVGVFQKQVNARKLSEKLKDSRIQEIRTANSGLFRVVVGNFLNFEKALEMRNHFRRNGFSRAFVIPAS
ncbi:MAG: septal ring lytic transglycosylase RlpA family lipoprotein [Nitrospinae bacterium CG11_big_fil_rev_8_21_14_0_20_56_8]|nr:MAG: septal ring lytic transglycosylase RlpA family lipoprotein [Nitrospinae bacterium CG11_big_fil_rev_8_21_14_0_20_56_8]